ncbi:GIY-YIG nuclease family protein [Nonlabens sp. YIK11]|uniref:GIY-YIG nuclease family protein n=1 Tax=Nonlabens sp. YIK11 TaxID=1453349 RepID=UPI0006DCF509|nr:GIY-YIG nuclease family protein [Nonlabens sp. YIK11]
MKFVVYVIESELDGRWYKGVSKNFDSRLAQHNSGKTASTRPYRPWVLVHKEEFDTFAEARKRELYFKSGIGREYLKKVIRPRGATE